MPKSRVKFLGQQEVPVDDLKPHPANPNRGSVPDIAISLQEFGQYRSVVATKDLTILAGHHVVEAAKSVGLTTIRVDIVDASEVDARKIMLADNRLPELGLGNDFELLLKNLEDLNGDFEGTGFDGEYLQLLQDAVIGPPEPERGDGTGGGDGDYKQISITVDSRLAAQWTAHRKLFPSDDTAFAYLFGDPAEGD